jgi:diguanylate cyclase (GGDEF)-like protein
LVLRTISKFFLPGSIILIVTLVFVKVEFFSSLWSTIADIYPYTVFIVALLLGWRFSRSRLIFAILVLAIADRTIFYLNFEQHEALELHLRIFNIVAFFTPINIMLIALIKERGIFTLHGIGRFLIILGQPLIFYQIIKYHLEYAFNFLDYPIIQSAFLDRIPLTQPVLLIYLLAFLVTILNYVLKQDVVDGNFFWVLATSFFAFLSNANQPFSTIYFSSAGLILIVSVLEYSHSMAFRDELTGLPARRSLNETFLKLPNRYSIAMVDVDHFKKINDQYGHDVGDQVLRMIATKLQRVSGGGKAFRYGGEEIVLIFAGKGVSEIKPHVEDLRETIATNRFFLRSDKRPRKKPQDLSSVPKSRKIIPISISIGVAERDENHDTPQEVLRAADQALLRAKKSGRNRVRIYGKLNPKG